MPCWGVAPTLLVRGGGAFLKGEAAHAWLSPRHHNLPPHLYWVRPDLKLEWGLVQRLFDLVRDFSLLLLGFFLSLLWFNVTVLENSSLCLGLQLLRFGELLFSVSVSNSAYV